MLCKHAMLAYPDFEKPFDLYTNASNLQLGATLVQDGKPISFYTRKLNSAQQNYTVGKKELLGIVEGFKAFEGILRGTDVTVHTDHMNLLYKSLPSQQMQRWRLLLEEFHPQFKHVAGINNDAADALSILDMVYKASDTVDWGHPNRRMTVVRNKANNNFCKVLVAMNMTNSPTKEISDEITALDASEFNDACFDNCEFTHDVRIFEQHQQQDKVLQTIVNKELERHPNGTKYTTKEVEGVYLIHENNKIIVPTTLQERVMEWYHTILVHSGKKRMEESICSIYT